MREAIAFDSVSFSYPGDGLRALDDVTTTIEEGTFVLVCGATGSGKSTLIRAINGLVPQFTGGAFSGRVSVCGRDTLSEKPSSLADVVSFVPQDPGSSFVLDTVEDEIAYGMENLGIAAATMRGSIEECLDLLDLDHLRASSVRSISGGERQRVAIAAALAPRPRVLLLDEPTSQLDPQAAEHVLAALQRLVHDLGLTVVIAEHRLERVAGYVDVALGCRRGKVLSGSPSAVLDELGVGPPVATLGRLLGWRPLPLTVREARRRAPALSPDARRTAASPRSEAQPLVEAHALRAGYGSSEVLKGVDLGLGAGEIVALMGRNGSGKTTLLRCLTGLLAPRSGTVAAGEGAPVPGRSVALCPQTPEDILFRDRVDSEIETTLRANGRPEQAGAWLEELGIAALAGRHPRDLSAGERLLVGVAAVVATGAPVLLLDEPTRGLDPDAKRLLIQLLRRYVGGGRAVVFATHDVELAAELATRVVMLASGEIIGDGSPKDILGDSVVFAPQMTRVFGAGWLTPGQVAGALVHS